MPRRIVVLLAAVLLAAPSSAIAQTVQHGLKVPAGFEVTEFADARLANDIICMTLDPKGRVVVAGRGYIKILVDDDGDGKADRAITFADRPKDGAMGLLWEGKYLYVTGDGGLERFTTTDGDHADGPPEMIRKMKTGGEHTAHAITRGPDGWLYVLGGNVTGIDKSYAELPTSPVKNPIAGCVLRFTPDLKKCEILADGFRNPYGFDFNPDGELFTWDSDNERCVSLPWAEGTRFYHVIPGGNYGWMNPQIMTTWRKPPYFLDVVAPVIDLGRGSPTGVTCYRHVQFPEKYRGGFFLSDWTFGKVWFLPLKRAGASYKTTKELFLEAVGDNGFAPTASVVHPETGDLYISIGGRGTRGAVYRIRWSAGVKQGSAQAAAKWQPRALTLDWNPASKGELLVEVSAANESQRMRALLLVLRHADLFDLEHLLAAIKGSWNHPDPILRKLAADLIKTLPAEQRRALLQTSADFGWQRITVLQALVDDEPALVFKQILKMDVPVKKDELSQQRALALLRLMQQTLGDLGAKRAHGSVWEGYMGRLSGAAMEDRLGKEDLNYAVVWLIDLANAAGNAAIHRESTRALALLADCPNVVGVKGGGLSAVNTRFREPELDAVETIHLLAVQARLGGSSPGRWTNSVAGILLGLDAKLAKTSASRDSNWPLRVGELYTEMVRLDPDLPAAILKDPEFGRPDHVLFTKVKGFDRKAAAILILKKASADADYRWNAGLVDLVGELPDEEAQPVLRKLWGKAGLDAAILPILARKPQLSDRSKFLDGLSASNLATVRVSLQAVASFVSDHDNAEIAALIRALGTLPQGKEAGALREALGKQLEKATQQKLGVDRAAWLKWFATVDPKRAAALANPDGVDVAAWNKRLAKVDWSKGDAVGGKTVFFKANCAACHSGSQAIGPDLIGIAGRFSRDDLFTAILQPSRDIADRYQTTVIETTAGKLYQGIVVYEAVDGLILVTGPAQNVRLAGSEVAAKSVSRLSLMPAGLLDNLLDQEIVDLYAYLKSLGKKN